jgi:hypothetical protein
VFDGGDTDKGTFKAQYLTSSLLLEGVAQIIYDANFNYTDLSRIAAMMLINVVDNN